MLCPRSCGADRSRGNGVCGVLYTPMSHDGGIFDRFPELSRRVRKSEYEKLVNYAIDLGIENAYIQDMSVAKESFIPEFDNTGVEATVSRLKSS